MPLICAATVAKYYFMHGQTCLADEIVHNSVCLGLIQVCSPEMGVGSSVYRTLLLGVANCMLRDKSHALDTALTI